MKMMKILKIITFVNSVKKNIDCDKVRDHCHLTGFSGELLMVNVILI